MINKKKLLSIITIKTLLIALIFAGAGIIIIGGGLLIGERGKLSDNRLPEQIIKEEQKEELDIKIGSAEVDNEINVTAIQKSADEGHQPWRLNPDLVLLTVKSYGFTDKDLNNIDFGNAYYESGKKIYRIQHKTDFYLITLTQPATGENKIWIISKIEISEDETADWQIYRNEEYGFEVKYPLQTERVDYTKNGASFFYPCYSKEKEVIEKAAEYMKEIPEEGVPIMYNTFMVKAVDNSSQLSIKTWIQKYEHCGIHKGIELDITTVELEEFIFDGIKGIRIKNLGVCPPGAGIVRDKIYLPKDSKIYTIAIIEEAGLFPWGLECHEEQKNHFNQIVSSFKFIEK